MRRYLRTPGGTPKTTGIWYDDSYDRSLSPPLDASDLANGRNGDATCSVTGTEVKVTNANSRVAPPDYDYNPMTPII